MNIVVIIPTYNEIENIDLVINKLKSIDKKLRLIIVDDSSADGTALKAKEIAKKSDKGFIKVIQRNRKMGLGTAYIRGFTEALKSNAQIVIQMDADLSHPPHKLDDFINILKNYDVVIGSRYISGGGIDPKCGILRILLSKFSNFLIRKILGVKIIDVTSGFKAYRREVLEKIQLDKFLSSGFIFQSEIIFECYRENFKMKEIPYFFESRNFGESKLSFGVIFEALIKLILIRLKK